MSASAYCRSIWPGQVWVVEIHYNPQDLYSTHAAALARMRALPPPLPPPVPITAANGGTDG